MKWLILDMLVGFAAGAMGHQTRYLFRRISSEGMERLASYTTGTLTVIAVGTLTYAHLPELQNGRRYFAASLLSAVGVGSGVAAAWLVQGG